MKQDQDTRQFGEQRRTLIKGAAWSVPIVATAAAVPFASASPRCTGVGFTRNNWVVTPFTGTPRPNSFNAWSTPSDGPQKFGWMSEVDNDSTTANMSYWLYQEFTAYPEYSYTITYQVAGKFAPSTAGSTKQTVEVQASNAGTVYGKKTFTSQWAFGAAAPPAAGTILPDGSTQLPMWAAPQTVTPRTETITLGPGLSGPVRFQFYFLLAPRLGSAYPRYGSHDIWANATVVCNS